MWAGYSEPAGVSRLPGGSSQVGQHLPGQFGRSDEIELQLFAKLLAPKFFDRPTRSSARNIREHVDTPEALQRRTNGSLSRLGVRHILRHCQRTMAMPADDRVERIAPAGRQHCRR